jgi:hypothetical protein
MAIFIAINCLCAAVKRFETIGGINGEDSPSVVVVWSARRP